MVATTIGPRNKVSPAPIQNQHPTMQSGNKLPRHRMELEFQRRKWVKVVIHRVMVSENKHRQVGMVQMHRTRERVYTAGQIILPLESRE